MDVFMSLREELDSIDQWRERLADMGILDTGPMLDFQLGLASEALKGWTKYYRDLAEKAEKEMMK